MSRRKQPFYERIFENADRFERQIDDPSNRDDPRWLARLAKKMRTIARKKERAFEHKQGQKAKKVR